MSDETRFRAWVIVILVTFFILTAGALEIAVTMGQLKNEVAAEAMQCRVDLRNAETRVQFLERVVRDGWKTANNL